MRRILFPLLCLFAWPLAAQEEPRFEVDPSWPGPLPEKWINGQIGGVCVDAHDHIVIVDRRNITEEETETSIATAPIIMFDTSGKLVRSWGDPDTVPSSIHGCSFGSENNVWVAGNQDGIVQKYSHEGKLMMQIGERGVFDTTDGTATGKALNSARDRLFRPSAAAVHPDTADIYVSDGYGNKRVAVFDASGTFLRQWGRQASEEEVAAGTPGAFAQVVHCIAISRKGLVYVCDRQADRVQVFDGMGEYVRSIRIPADKRNARGTAWWVAFSPDPEQRYLYVMNGGQERVHVIDHASGETLSTFGRPGHQIGDFTHGHTLAVDSSGNLYVAETNWGRRVQRFKLVTERQ